MNIRLGLVSAYSFLFGVHKHSAILDKVAELGIKTVSFCDMNNLYGVHTFLEEAKERKIKPVIGCALTVNNDKRSIDNEKIIFCFVENRQGFSRLCEILTERNKNVDNFNPLPLLRENSQGLVLASSCDDVLECLKDNVNRLYAALTPFNSRAVTASRKLNIPMAFIDNSLMIEKSDFAVHKTVCAVRLLKTVGTLDKSDTADCERILKSSKDLHRFLVSWADAIKGAEEIAEICKYDDLFNGWIFPNYENCGMQTEGQKTGDFKTFGFPPAEELKKRVYEGNDMRYGGLCDRETDRINYELEIINKKGFAPYFLVIDDIVKMAKAANGGYRTCGRGSGAASIVSYGLGITNVDPIRHDLYFERFLNPSRPDPPDLDIDFAWDERDELIKNVIEKFGTEYCARVANHNMFRYRSALRETAKAYGFGDAEITAVERRLFTGGLVQMGDKSVSIEPVWQEIFTITKKLEGLPRGLGMHCGGIVITPEPICKYAPVEKSAEGYPLLAWEKEGTEAAGFVKIDLLGNRSLAVIRDAIANLEEQNIYIDQNTWKPVDDKSTIEALAHGDSIGVFYIESPAMRQLQKRTNRGDFEHIVIHSSIIRPAANKFIAEYVRRLKGGKWKPLHPRLENILKESYGILCYQEDVSKTAVALAGFNEADADKLRKVIAKKMGGAKLAVYQEQFFEGCRKNNVSEDTIQKIWDMMLSFDGYSFCKPHSASYAMVSYQSAYLRVHHGAEFIAAVLSNQGGFYRPHAYIAEARRMKLFVEGPDVNISRWHYYGKENEVIIGLMAIKGLSVSGAKTLLEERDRNGGYKNLDDFSGRVKLGRDDIIALCPAGVFDSIADGMPRYLQVRSLLASNAGKIKNGQVDLFAADPAPIYHFTPKSSLTTEKKKVPLTDNDLWGEYNALGFLRKMHPLALWKDDVYAVKYRVKAIRIADYAGQNVKMIGWQVTQKEVYTKDGLVMSFLSLEDETALYETVIFPQVYDKYNKLLFDQRPLLVYGKVVNDEGAVSLEVSRLEWLGKANANSVCSARGVKDEPDCEMAG
ncbi:MAG: DNA polymerase III subunit alpha [Treponema sp.]|nr:DNA polymerase III subunit alpha [Treponema sp.]